MIVLSAQLPTTKIDIMQHVPMVLSKFNVMGAEFLLENIKNQNIENVILKYACAQGDLSLVKFAIEHGADINSDYGLPLYYATEKNHKEVIKYLISNGADIHMFFYCVIEQSLIVKNYDILIHVLQHKYGTEVTEDNWGDYLIKLLMVEIKVKDPLSFTDISKIIPTDIKLSETARVIANLNKLS